MDREASSLDFELAKLKLWNPNLWQIYYKQALKQHKEKWNSAFATNTCVVELYRPDGMLMKIHICTDSFEELLQAFYKGSQ